MAIRRNLGIPSGVVFPFAGGVAPSGYLICDGSAISRADYPQLFLTIGTSHGQGDGSTTFNLPDYRGKFLRGVDGLAGVDPDKASRTAMATGGNTGDAVGSVQGDSFGTHTHIQNAHSHVLTVHSAGAGARALSGTGAQLSSTSTETSVATNQNSGGNETRPKNVNVNYIIKV